MTRAFDRFDVVVKTKTEPARFRYVSGLPFGQPGDTVVATISAACLQVKSDPTLRNPVTMQTQTWSYRIETTDMRGIAVESPDNHARRSWIGQLLPFVSHKAKTDGCEERVLIIRAEIFPGRVQAIKLTGTVAAVEALAAQLEDECHFYRDKRCKNANEGWRD